MNSLIGLTPKALRKAADLQERIESLQEELSQILGAGVSAPVQAAEEPKKRKKFSAAAKANMRSAQQARWAGIKKPAPEVEPAPKKARKELSAAVRKARSEAMKARWAKAKRAGKSEL
jgi:hypothetical protein